MPKTAAKRPARASKRPGRTPKRPPAEPTRAGPPAMEAAATLTDSIRNLAGQVMDIANAAVDASLGVGGLLARDKGQRKDLARAGTFLRKVREQAGLTIADVAQALDLKDVVLLELAENGKAALPFEVILRLAAVLARNDPIPFVLNLTNTYSPAVGRTLTALGVGRLVEHARREHAFINIYRARDTARRLSDAEFVRVLAFVEAAFDLALDFTASSARARRHGKAAAAAATPADAPGQGAA